MCSKEVRISDRLSSFDAQVFLANFFGPQIKKNLLNPRRDRATERPENYKNVNLQFLS